MTWLLVTREPTFAENETHITDEKVIANSLELASGSSNTNANESCQTAVEAPKSYRSNPEVAVLKAHVEEASDDQCTTNTKAQVTDENIVVNNLELASGSQNTNANESCQTAVEAPRSYRFKAHVEEASDDQCTTNTKAQVTDENVVANNLKLASGSSNTKANESCQTTVEAPRSYRSNPEVAVLKAHVEEASDDRCTTNTETHITDENVVANNLKLASGSSNTMADESCQTTVEAPRSYRSNPEVAVLKAHVEEASDDRCTTNTETHITDENVVANNLKLASGSSNTMADESCQTEVANNLDSASGSSHTKANESCQTTAEAPKSNRSNPEVVKDVLRAHAGKPLSVKQVFEASDDWSEKCTPNAVRKILNKLAKDKFAIRDDSVKPMTFVLN